MNVSKKKSLSRFGMWPESIEDGDYVQILHVGPYDDEPESFMKVDESALLIIYNVLTTSGTEKSTCLMRERWSPLN